MDFFLHGWLKTSEMITEQHEMAGWAAARREQVQPVFQAAAG
jgi:hypothetical protein